VDDLKISHIDKSAVEAIIKAIEQKYGKEDPVTVTRGKIHDYLGMTIDFSEDGKVKFTMFDYIENLLEGAPDDMDGTAVTPAGVHLFDVNDSADKLCGAESDLYHHITAQLLYLCKRACPDIQIAVAFLCTRVSCPDMDDRKKLTRVVHYLRGSKTLPLILEADQKGVVQWWINASFASTATCAVILALP
jgi:hypothetical protein